MYVKYPASSPVYALVNFWSMMMARRIVLIQGHPDPGGGRFGHALAAAYTRGAERAGHQTRTITVATLEFPLLRTRDDWEHGSPPLAIRDAQEAIADADHLVILFPLWLGCMPALLKAFLEQVLRPGFAFSQPGAGKMAKKLLSGTSARVVITMGMPAFVYRGFFRAHGLKTLKRNILGFCGIGPVADSVIGMVEGAGARREKWLIRMEDLGRTGR
jgi:putative NADPH-quinone reductase